MATGHGRTALGFDLDERNVDLARDRVGPMFFSSLTLAEWIDQAPDQLGSLIGGPVLSVSIDPPDAR